MKIVDYFPHLPLAVLVAIGARVLLLNKPYLTPNHTKICSTIPNHANRYILHTPFIKYKCIALLVRVSNDDTKLVIFSSSNWLRAAERVLQMLLAAWGCVPSVNGGIRLQILRLTWTSNFTQKEQRVDWLCLIIVSLNTL